MEDDLLRPKQKMTESISIHVLRMEDDAVNTCIVMD